MGNEMGNEMDFLELEAWACIHAPEVYEVGHYLQVESAHSLYLIAWRERVEALII